jgi:hexosaminidase
MRLFEKIVYLSVLTKKLIPMIDFLPFSKVRFTTILVVLIFHSMFSFSENKYNIIPYPQQLIPQSGSFVFNTNTRIICDVKQTDILKLATQFLEHFQIVSALKLNISPFQADTANAVIFEKTKIENPEGYQLTISDKTIRIKADSPIGFFYALQTMYQLMPVEIYGQKKIGLKKWSVPAVQIADAPRFAYRGLHLDVCRHFFPIEFIKEYIDAMAIHKLNYFHWHLTDDQGWRIEIKKYPKLTEIGSKRDETLIGYYFSRSPQLFDGKPYGGFYTQAEAREIVAYARDRFITVIPEIEMPGHAQAAIASYPYLSCTRNPNLKVATKWGVFPDVFCPRDSTFKFLEDVLTEIMDIFPGMFIHIGGDECPKDRWKACPDCQALIKKEGLKDENELQSYFIKRIERFVNSKGRQIIGWDEILDGGLAPNATVMSWRGVRGGIAAAKNGNDVIMTPSAQCYFDHYQSNPVTEPVTIGGYLPLEMVYRYEPVPTELNADEAKHILGAQANLWTEYMPESENVEYMAFPRISALSEMLWSTRANRNWDLFRNRMTVQMERYKQLNINASKAFYDVQFKTNFTSDNQIQITLSCDCPNAQIQYEINGKKTLYKAPFILKETTNVSVKSFVNGHELGKTNTQRFVVSKITGISYTKTPNNTWYDGGNINALTDGVLGNNVVYTQWVGTSHGKDAEIIVDLKKTQSIDRFSAGFLHAPALCVVLPSTLKVYGSVDEKNYKFLSEYQIARSLSPTWEIVRPVLSFDAVKIRFLKIEINSGGNCLPESPGTAEGSLIFMDEIGAW